MKHESSVPYLWMLGGCVVFSIMGALAYALRTHYDWQIIALVRASIPFLLVSTLAWTAGVPLVVWRPRIIWMRSIGGSISLICTFYCLTRLPQSLVLTITSLYPIWVTLLSWPMERRRPRLPVWLAALVGVLGVAVIQRPGGEIGETLPVVLAVIASLATSVALVGLNRLRSVDTRAVVAHFSGVAVVFALAAWLVSGPTRQLSSDPLAICGLIGVGLTATAGQFCLTKAFTHGPAPKVSVIGLTQILFAMGLDVMLFDKTFDPVTLLGVALVMAPTAWILIRRRPRAQPPSDAEIATRLTEGSVIVSVGPESPVGPRK